MCTVYIIYNCTFSYRSLFRICPDMVFGEKITHHNRPQVIRAGPSRCGAQCKTWARGSNKTQARGPSVQWFYNVIVFSQPCYDRGRTKICSTAPTRELSTFANVREEICYFWRVRSLLTMKFMWRFYWILERKVYLTKMNNLPKHHGAGPQETRAQCSSIGCIGLRPALQVIKYSNLWRAFRQFIE